MFNLTTKNGHYQKTMRKNHIHQKDRKEPNDSNADGLLPDHDFFNIRSFFSINFISLVLVRVRVRVYTSECLHFLSPDLRQYCDNGQFISTNDVEFVIFLLSVWQ